MRILNVTGDAFYPQVSGGVQVCLNELMQAMKAAGHEPSMFVALWGGKIATRSRIAMKLTGKSWVRHTWDGFDVYRAWRPWEHAQDIYERVKPDVVLVHGTKHTYPIAKAYLDMGVPISLYFHDVYFDLLGGDLKALDKIKYISNSIFTQKRVEDALGVSSGVVPPVFFDTNIYKVATDSQNVTFINPVPEKGGDIAFKVAELCPEIPFHFVQSWNLSPAQEEDIKQKLKVLTNIRFSRPVYDMRQIYQHAKLMLVPSQVDEAWGRVVSEAQCSGIPAVYSKVGGLPEAAGDAGIGIDRDAPASAWADAVRSLWANQALYQEKSDAAKAMAGKILDERCSRLDELLTFQAA